MNRVAPSNDQPNTERPTARGEWLSALFDGETDPVSASGWGDASDAAAHRATWDAYRCIGESLRAPGGVAQQGADPAFVRAVMQRVAAEPAPALQPEASVPVPRAERPAANESVFRWKMVAGVATLAAVVAVAWQVGAVPGAVPVAPQMAQATPPAPVVVSVPVQTAAGAVVVVRDPQLEELMAAHRQWGGASALQTSAGFLRAASYDVPTR